MYIPLFNQTNYTLLSSLIKIEDLIDYSKNNNISMISICDKNMFKTMDFYKLCKANNIKPIIGLNIILEDYEVVLFAKDYIGYKNLIKLSTIQSERKVTSDDLNKYNHNLYCILPFNSKNLFDELRNIYLDLYLGYTNKGVTQILVTIFTCGIGSLWGFVEGIMILAGSINCDSDGVPLKD